MIHLGSFSGGWLMCNKAFYPGLEVVEIGQEGIERVNCQQCLKHITKDKQWPANTSAMPVEKNPKQQ